MDLITKLQEELRKRKEEAAAIETFISMLRKASDGEEENTVVEAPVKKKLKAHRQRRSPRKRKKCEECGKGYLANRVDQRHCSPLCRKNAWNSQHPGRKSSKSVSRARKLPVATGSKAPTARERLLDMMTRSFDMAKGVSAAEITELGTRLNIPPGTTRSILYYYRQKGLIDLDLETSLYKQASAA